MAAHCIEYFRCPEGMSRSGYVEQCEFIGRASLGKLYEIRPVGKGPWLSFSAGLVDVQAFART